MAVEVTTYSGIAEVRAFCECGWEAWEINAMPNAKRHAKTYGHVVHVDQVIGVTYAPEGMSKDEVFSMEHSPHK